MFEIGVDSIGISENIKGRKAVKLTETFGDKAISKRGVVHWPARCVHLLPLDFFLMGM